MTSICCCCAVIPVAAVNKDRSMSCSFLGASGDIVYSSSSGIIERLNDFLIGFVGPRSLYDRDQETDRFDIGRLDYSLPHHGLRRCLRRHGDNRTKEAIPLFFQGIRLWQIDYSETIDDRAPGPHLTYSINLNLPLRQSQGTFVAQDREPL